MRFFTQTALIVLFSGIALSFSACKKGADDPFISLRSRTARLTGVWKLTNEQIKTTTIRNGSVSQTIESTYDGSIWNIVKTVYDKNGNPSVTINKYTASTTWTINKDHSLKLESNWDGDSYKKEGTWIWLDGNGADLKNKEAVQFLIAKEIFGGTSVEFSGNQTGPLLVLSRLANDEMQVDLSHTSTNTDVTEIITGKQTFRQ